ncbi:hypothetical protein EDD17DRAFT_1514749 [Pisolithus thermaeus]|nr:hypothetical protein EDD17DRAFT_1514749 [Pisolithus thermaeus]
MGARTARYTKLGGRQDAVQFGSEGHVTDEVVESMYTRTFAQCGMIMLTSDSIRRYACAALVGQIRWWQQEGANLLRRGHELLVAGSPATHRMEPDKCRLKRLSDWVTPIPRQPTVRVPPHVTSEPGLSHTGVVTPSAKYCVATGRLGNRSSIATFRITVSIFGNVAHVTGLGFGVPMGAKMNIVSRPHNGAGGNGLGIIAPTPVSKFAPDHRIYCLPRDALSSAASKPYDAMAVLDPITWVAVLDSTTKSSAGAGDWVNIRLRRPLRRPVLLDLPEVTWLTCRSGIASMNTLVFL